MSNVIIGVSSNGTKVYAHPDAHPHRLDLASESISKMVIPTVPADPTDRAQTRVCATVDLGHIIGVNHLIHVDYEDITIRFDRGRGYESQMTLEETEPETKVTSVCFWNNEENHWVLWTNFEGYEGLPEPGCDRYNKASNEFKSRCRNFWTNYHLVPTEEEVKLMKTHTWNLTINTADQYGSISTLYDEISFDELVKIYNEEKQSSCFDGAYAEIAE